MKVLKKMLLLLFLAPVSAFAQESSSCAPANRYVASSNVQTNVVRVRKVEGMALLAFGGTDERNEIASVSGVCLALYSMPDGRLVATSQTSASSLNSGVFHFAGVAPGRYRLVSVLTSKALIAPIDAPVRVVRWPRGGVFKRANIYLHFRFQRSGVASYASSTRKKPAIIDTPSYSARHNNGMQRTRN
jgi:hypothetical protein